MDMEGCILLVSKSSSTGTAYILGEVYNRTSILYEEMFVFIRFFPHWVFSEKLFRLVAPRLRKSYLALISAHVWIDPSLVL